MYPKRVLLDEARQWGIAINPIDINYSDATYRIELVDGESESGGRAPFTAVDSKSSGKKLSLPDASGFAIRMALSDIGGISGDEIAKIIAGRPYLDLADFIYRSGVSRPVAENLVMIGALDRIHNLNNSELNRRDLLLHLQDLYRLTGSKNSGDQLTFELRPTELLPSGLPDLTTSEQVRSEVAITGMDISTHLLEFYGDFLNSIGAVRSSDLMKHRAGSSVLVAGVKVSLQTPPIRSGRRVMFLTLDDGHGCNDLTFFEDVQNSYAGLLKNSWLFLARGVIRRTGARGISLRATAAWDLAASYEKWRNLSSRDGAISG